MAVFCCPASGAVQVTGTCRVHQHRPWDVAVVFFTVHTDLFRSDESCLESQVQSSHFDHLRIQLVQSAVDILYPFVVRILQHGADVVEGFLRKHISGKFLYKIRQIQQRFLFCRLRDSHILKHHRSQRLQRLFLLSFLHPSFTISFVNNLIFFARNGSGFKYHILAFFPIIFSIFGKYNPKFPRFGHIKKCPTGNTFFLFFLFPLYFTLHFQIHTKAFSNFRSEPRGSVRRTGVSFDRSSHKKIMTRGHFLQIQIFDNHRTFFQQLLMNIIPRCLISDSFLLHTEQHQFFSAR